MYLALVSGFWKHYILYFQVQRMSDDLIKLKTKCLFSKTFYSLLKCKSCLHINNILSGMSAVIINIKNYIKIYFPLSG